MEAVWVSVIRDGRLEEERCLHCSPDHIVTDHHRTSRWRCRTGRLGISGPREAPARGASNSETDAAADRGGEELPLGPCLLHRTSPYPWPPEAEGHTHR